MAPLLRHVLRRSFNLALPATELEAQWRNPGDVTSVLLILGGDIIARALAQLAGSRATPVAFSFGWVAYIVTALVSVIGEKTLMPLSDSECLVINGKSGSIRHNRSWVIGRIVRDFDYWMDAGQKNGKVRRHLEDVIERKWATLKQDAIKKREPVHEVERPTRAGLCVSVYNARPARPGYPGYDLAYWSGYLTAALQIGTAVIPFVIWGDWSILLVTIAGILLSFATGLTNQWKNEKWHCRKKSDKTVILTRGNGSQHAIVIIGRGVGFDLEDLAAGPDGPTVLRETRLLIILLALLWILLLITTSGIKQNTWFLVLVGAIGIVDNIYVAGARRHPKAFGVPLEFEEVFGEPKVMHTLLAVEEKYPRVGRSMLETFFPGQLRPDEVKAWDAAEKIADEVEKREKAQRKAAQNASQNAQQAP